MTCHEDGHVSALLLPECSYVWHVIFLAVRKSQMKTHKQNLILDLVGRDKWDMNNFREQVNHYLMYPLWEIVWNNSMRWKYVDSCDKRV